jgi:membrane protein
MIKGVINSVYKTLSEKRLTTVAGAWVYYFLIALIPLSFLLVTAFSVFGVSLTGDLVSRLPEELREAGNIVASTAENASKGATIFFVLTVLFSCTTLLNQMSKDGDFIYGMHSNIKRGLMRRVFAVLAIALLFAIFLSIAFLLAFSSSIKIDLLSSEKNQILLNIFIFSIVIIFGYAIIITLNAFICPKKVKIATHLLGSFISLCIMVLGTIGFIVYLRYFARYNLFYGSLASVIIFLLWAYILMLGLVIGVIINMKTYKKTSIFKEKENA